MVNVSIDVTDLGGEARPGDKVVFWRPRMGGSATHAGRVISTAPVTVFLTDGKATVSDVEPGEMTVLLQCRGVESQGPVTVGVPDGNGTVTLRALLESQFEYAPPIVSAVQEAASNASASEEAAIQAQIRSEAAADRADAKVDDAINNGANLIRAEVKQDADRAVSARQAATQSESNAKASESAADSSASNAKTSETNAKQSETNAGDFAAVATTAATEAVDAMERATDLAGGNFTTHEYVDGALALKADKTYVDSTAWLKPALGTDSNVDSLPSGIYPVPTSTVATTLGLPLGEPGELETTWLDSSGLRRRQTLHVDPYLGDRPGYAMYRRWYYNGTWQPWVRYDDAWSKGALSSSSVLSNLAQGSYEVPSAAVAKSLGLPSAEIGTLTIYWIAKGLYRRAVFDVDLVAGHRQYRARYYNGTWYDWKLEIASSTPYFRGEIPANTQPDSMIGNAWNGEWTYLSGNQSAWGVPSNSSGLLRVSASGASTLQEITTFTTPIQKYQRRAYNGAWSGPWEIQTGGDSTAPTPTPVDVDEYVTAASKGALNALVPSTVDPTTSYVSDHAALVADMKTRVGDVQTGGKAAIALVADHGTTAFKEWLWAEAKARNIPFTMALAPEVHLDGKGDTRHTASNDDIKQWISEGLVIASHSGDHLGATGYLDVHRQIVTSKRKLEEKLGTSVDCWVQPGYSTELGSYDGFGSGQSASRYSDYYAGRLLQQTYPVITGYVGSDYIYPGDADLPVGVRRSLTERKDGYQTVVDYIEQAISTGGKHINFCHPYALPDSSSTYVTKTEYVAYLDWLVQKRDAGDLVLLTLPQLMVARP